MQRIKYVIVVVALAPTAALRSSRFTQATDAIQDAISVTEKAPTTDTAGRMRWELITIGSVCLSVPTHQEMMVNRLSTDATALNDTDNFTVEALLQPPVAITSGDGQTFTTVSVAEGNRAVTDFEVNVGDANVTYQINAGADRDLFEIDAITGELSFKVAPDWENPQDADRNNVYDVNVIAFNAHSGDGQFLSVVVDNVEGASDVEIISNDTGAPNNDYSTIQVTENTSQVTDVTLLGSESGVRYSINNGADRDLFDIDAETGVLSFKQAPDFENPQDQASATAAAGDNNYEINVLAIRDEDGQADSQYLTISVTDEPDTIAEPVSVYLMAGQSNLVGQALTENLDPSYAAPFPGAQVWNRFGNEFVTLEPGFDGQTETVGPEFSFARRITERSGEDVYIVKYGLGGTNLAQDWNPDGSGAQYNTFTQTVDAALANLKADGVQYQIDGLVWMQGESDTYNDQFAPVYQDNLTNFISNVRGQYGADLEVALGLIRDDLPTSRENLDLVREAQQMVAGADSRVQLVNTDALGPAEEVMRVEIGDFTHYNATGQVRLGNAFGDAFTV
ncbi:MAG: sialate O-acetylesterase [Phormidesmis sp.]